MAVAEVLLGIQEMVVTVEVITLAMTIQLLDQAVAAEAAVEAVRITPAKDMELEVVV